MIKKTLEKILKVGTIGCIILLIASVLLQIFARFFLEQAPSWTEEVSRLFFIFSVACAAPLALKSNYYIHLDIFYNLMKPKLQKKVEFLVLVFTFLLFLVLSIAAVTFVEMGFDEKSPSMGIKMGIAFFSMLVLGVTMCFFISLKLLKHIKKMST